MSIGQRQNPAAPHSNAPIGGFHSSVHTLELTVPHKTVAEPYWKCLLCCVALLVCPRRCRRVPRSRCVRV